jgi:hypothetical protein
MKKTITLLTFLFVLNSISSQNYKFGKVALSEVTNNIYEKDTSASAVVLYKYRNTYFNYQHPEGWVLITEVHKRIKILNKDGLDYATEEVSLYKSSKSKESISSIKGYTYNEAGGKLTKEKLKRSSVFDTKTSDNWDKTSFTMPKAKVGSVVEWKYKITSPFWKIDDLTIQEDIPTKQYHAKIEILNYFNLKRIVKGGFSVIPKEYKEPRTLTVMWEQDTNRALTQATRSSTIQTTEYVHEYELKDIPALKEELYVDNIDNYRYLINYELMSTQFPKSALKQYSTTWEKVVKSIYKDEDFGKELEKNKYFNDDLDKIISNSSGKIELLNNIFNFVKNKMTWNNKSRRYTQDGVKKAYKNNSGNVAEINFILIAMLKKVGIKANPVLISTRSHGIPAFPTIEGFNYVIVCAEINGKEILMDATEKQSIPGLLPERVINWEGTLMLGEEKFRKIRLYPTKTSQNNTLLSITINEDGSIQGKQQKSYSLNEALNYRNSNKNVNKDSYLETIIDSYQLDDAVGFKVENMDNLDKTIKESFSFEADEGVEIIGSELYFQPLFFLALNENPFKAEERNYPINYVFPRLQRKIINITIPEGYEVTSLPKPIKIKMPENFGSFLFNISKTETGINVMSEFKINSAVIPAYSYGELKEFYNQRVLKEAEKVVLTKM